MTPKEQPDKKVEKKQYTFMLILPKNLISDKINAVNTTVGNDIL